MKYLILALCFMATSAFADPRTIGNGGGGVVRDGVYMTFGSAGVYVDPEPLGLESVPGMSLLLRTIRETGLGDSEKDSLMAVIAPFGARAYFNVVKEKFDDPTYQRLREEYARIAKQPPEAIVIFAVTDPASRKTFLLPEFFGLREVEQAAILFHEAYWVMKPDASYQEVVSAEVAFQRFVEQRALGVYDPKLAEKLAILFDDPSLSINMYLRQDLASGALAELGADARGVPAAALMEHAICDDDGHYWRGWYRGAATTSNSYARFYDLSIRYPQSHFLRGVLNFLAPDARGVSGRILVGLSEGEMKEILSHPYPYECRHSLEALDIRIIRIFHDEAYGVRALYLDHNPK